MQNKSILFALAVCISMQFGISFGAQEPAQAQSWSDWFSSRAGKAWSAAKNAPGRVVEATKSNLNESWSDSKKAIDFISPSRSAYQTGHTAALTAYTLLNTSPHLVAGASASLFGGFISPELVVEQMKAIDPNFAGKLVLAAGTGAFIYTYVLQKAVAYYRAQDITREQAVSQVKDAISFVLSDSMAYPTRSSKIHALLKKNEFIGIDMKDEDGIVAQACAELSKEIAAVNVDAQQKAKDSLIDLSISSLKRKMVGKSLDEQIKIANKDVSDIFTLLAKPENIAAISTVLRLQKQQLVEQQNEGIFERTSSSKFYEPITSEDNAAVQTRKGMTSEQWKEYRQQQQAIRNKPIESTTIGD